MRELGFIKPCLVEKILQTNYYNRREISPRWLAQTIEIMQNHAHKERYKNIELWKDFKENFVTLYYAEYGK